MSHTLVKYIEKGSELEYIENKTQNFHLWVAYKEILFETASRFYFTLVDKTNMQQYQPNFLRSVTSMHQALISYDIFIF